MAQKVLGIPLYKYDVFLAVTGGLKVEETGADLAIVGAMWSSYKNAPIKTHPLTPSLDRARGTVLVGEVSLLGEVKKVRGMEKRKKEALGLGMDFVEMTTVSDLKKMI